MLANVADEEKHLIPLRFVLSIIGVEFQELSGVVNQIQSTLSPILGSIDLDRQGHRDVQSLDVLSQKLTSLSLYILELSKLLPEDLQVDTGNALSSISISALKHRLKGASAPLAPEHLSGDLEIF